MKPVASILGIPENHIFANNLLFKSSGEFLGFDTREPTSRSGGKAVAVQQIKKVQAVLTSEFFFLNYFHCLTLIKLIFRLVVSKL